MKTSSMTLSGNTILVHQRAILLSIRS